jgi:hypothetical protein
MTAATFKGQAEVIWLPQRQAAPGFTARDRAELHRWESAGRRVVLCDWETVPFAMLHDGATPWASWAVAREEGAVLVWNCVSLEDLGRFDCMADALSAVLGAVEEEGWQAGSNVIPFAAARARLDVHAGS